MREGAAMKKLIGATALAFGLTILSGISPALANTVLSTTPTSGQSLESAPSVVTITTELPVMDSGNEVIVTDPSGVRVDDGTLSIAENEVVVGLTNLTRVGIYTVTYTLLAENDLPLTGSFRFNFNEPQVIAPVTPQPTPTQSSTPTGNDAGTNLFVFGLLLASLVVTVALARYAGKLYRER
jgi:methionine-rich copper-binding protein CopC